MKKNLLPLLGIAFVVAIIATGIFYGLIVGRLRSSQGRPQPGVVVAARSLERGTVLETSLVKLVDLPTSGRPKGALSDPEQLAGLTVVQPVGENQPITLADVAPRDPAGAGGQWIPSGMRAVSIRVIDSPGVTNLLRTGHKVDIQVVRNRNTQGSGDTELRTVLQDIEVLAVQPEAAGRTGPGAVVTLLAKPAEADTLSVADAGARIRLLLRNPRDREQPPLPNLALTTLFARSSVSGARAERRLEPAAHTNRSASLLRKP